MKRKILFVVCFLIIFVSLAIIYFYPRPTKKETNQLTSFPISEILTQCPDGFILVSNFCVMKYDAKCTNPDPKCVTKEGVYNTSLPGCACENTFKVVSTPTGAPITYIPEDDGTNVSAKAYCKNAGWHLITNDEWMTVANNVAEVPANWCNKDGTGCGNLPGTSGKILANGHNDSVPAKALAAGDDNQPCFGTTSDNSNICGGKSSQKRTLTLTNGQIIWDFAGNVWQWIDITIARKDEPRTIIPGLGNLRWTWGELQTVPQNPIYSPPDPSWNSKMGIGRIFHFNSLTDTDATLYTFIRSGNWRHGYDSGIFTVHMQPVPDKKGIDDIGFRCVADPVK